MRILFTALIVSVLVASCATTKQVVSTAPTPFDALVGHWEGPLGGGTYIEKWEKKSDQYLQGEGYWIRGQDTILVEDLSIRKLGQHWGYIAIINNAPPTLFTCTKMETGQWTFNNPEHDYPQEIGYELQNGTALHAWTDGQIKGKPRKDEYFMKKVDQQ